MMSETEKSAVVFKRKNEIDRMLPNDADNDVFLNCKTFFETKGPCLRKRKMRRTKNSNSNIPPVSVRLPERITVDDNVEAIPTRMRRQKKSTSELSEHVGSEFKFTSKSSKKVSFNDTVHSRFINERLKFRAKNESNQSPPKSILKPTKHLGTFASNNRKNKRKKTRRTAKNKTVSKPENTKRSRAFLYLEAWKNDKTIWKFEKVVQTWLLKNMFDETILPEDKFFVLLDYMTEMRGAAVLLAKQLSEDAIKHFESISDNVESESSCHRARIVLQYLQK